MTKSKIARTMHAQLPAFSRKSMIHAIVECPRKTRNKYKYSPEHGVFELDAVLPEGMYFPHDFGFIPSTLGEDGDPLDVLLLTDEPTFVGCVMEARLVGVIEAMQTEHKRSFRNDRLIAVPCASHVHASTRSLHEVEAVRLDEIEKFFIAYNRDRGKKFKPIARRGPGHARKLVVEGIKRLAKHPGSK